MLTDLILTAGSSFLCTSEAIEPNVVGFGGCNFTTFELLFIPPADDADDEDEDVVAVVAAGLGFSSHDVVFADDKTNIDVMI